MRLPNGYGSIKKLQGKRRRPYQVCLGCQYQLIDGQLKQSRPILGYYQTKKEALEALAAYHKDPFDVGKNPTFADLYDKFISEKTRSKACIGAYRAAFKRCSAVHDAPIRDIRPGQLQHILDTNADASASTLHNMKLVITGIYSYAMRNAFIQKDISAYIKIHDHAAPKVERKVFTPSEISALWDMPQSAARDCTLILLYTGWRVSELLTMTADNIDLNRRILKGGVKTKAGKDRVVPIHPRIYDLVAASMPFGISYRIIRDWMQKYTGHTCHDTRHTFISELQSRGADEICIERLVGHASKSITDKVYTHKDIAELRAAVELIAYKDITLSEMA